MELKGKIVNFLGDSITQGAGASNPKYSFVEQFKKLTKVKKANNYGIGGTRIARKTVPSENEVYDQDYVGRFTDMDKDADIVVVFGGTNDYGHGDAKIGTFESRDVHTFYGACHTLMCGLSEMYVGKPIVFITPLHRENENKKDMNGHVLKDYVKVIKEVAAYYSIPVLDLYATSGIQPEIPVVKERLAPDGLHPNDAGHLILAERIKGFLEAL
ncbi:MAG: SGNH/GDSL hydrolase family protein [Clostridia bacterium]|nr:SGNH/GDSL hydrolase family protein [Clostridia bacterium]